MARATRVTVGTITPGTTPDPFVLGESKPTATASAFNGLQVPESSLIPYPGDFHFTANDQVLEGYDITGRVFFDSTSRTKLRNCIIRGGPTSAYGTQWTHVSFFGEDGTDRLMEFCEVRPSHPTVDSYGLSGWGYTARRNIIRKVVDTVNIHRSASGRVHSAQIEGNYEEPEWYAVDPRQSNGPTHNDGHQVFSGSLNRIEGNLVVGNSQKGNGVTCTPNSTTGAAKLANMIIRKNWFEGCYTQIEAWDSGTTFDAVAGLVITGNRHGVGANGSAGDHRWDILLTAENYSLAADVSGNVRDPGGAGISPTINN